MKWSWQIGQVDSPILWYFREMFCSPFGGFIGLDPFQGIAAYLIGSAHDDDDDSNKKETVASLHDNR